MPCGIPACVTKIVHVSIKNINIPAKLVGFSFLWVYMGSSRWERNKDRRPFFMLHPQMPCPMNHVAVVSPRAELWWRKRSWRRRKALHPSLCGLHVIAHILLLWEGCGWRASGCTGAVPLSIVSGPLLAAWVLPSLFPAVWILDLESLVLMFVVLHILLHRFLFSHFPV